MKVPVWGIGGGLSCVSSWNSDDPPTVRSCIATRGQCGFGWVNVRDRKFGNWLKNGKGRKDNYAGGVTIWISDYGRSHGMKEARAYAMAKVLSEESVTAYGKSHLDQPRTAGPTRGSMQIRAAVVLQSAGF